MFGCLGKFIKLFVIILAVIGFFTIGGVTFFKNFIQNPFTNAQNAKNKNAMTICDYSNLDKEFEVVSSSKIPTVGTYLYIKHTASSQHFIFLKSDKKNFLTKKDFAQHNADTKILEFIKDFGLVKFEDFKINGHGTINGMGQTIPFAKFESGVVNLPVKAVIGIIGSAERDKENILIMVYNSHSKYSQIITNALFNQIK